LKKIIIIFAFGFACGMLFEKAGGFSLITDGFRKMTGFVNNVGDMRKVPAKKVEKQVGKF
jgi:glycerol-3-phosphate dehydrogenase